MNWSIIAIIAYIFLGGIFYLIFSKKYEKQVFDYLDLNNCTDLLCLRITMIGFWLPFLAIVGIAAIVNGLNELCFKLEDKICGGGKIP